MMRIVIDAHVLVSSFFGGPPREVVDRWRNGRAIWCLSPDILDEYVEVLGRLGMNAALVRELLNQFARGYCCLYAAETPELRVVQADPDDDEFIACAVALDARVVVAGDKGLLAVERYFDIPVLTPRAFLDQFPEEN